MLKIYILILGSILLILGSIEFFRPLLIFNFWKTWISHRFFFLHGLLLIILGLPLCYFRQTVIGNVIFIIGLILVFTGPFILFFPDTLRNIFLTTLQELNEKSIKQIIYFDAFVRITVGVVFLYSQFGG